jgi:hypothetical protein
VKFQSFSVRLSSKTGYDACSGLNLSSGRELEKINQQTSVVLAIKKKHF